MQNSRRLLACLVEGPQDHLNTTISNSGSKDQYKGDTRNVFCRILVFMWSFEALLVAYPLASSLAILLACCRFQTWHQHLSNRVTARSNRPFMGGSVQGLRLLRNSSPAPGAHGVSSSKPALEGPRGVMRVSSLFVRHVG